MFFKIIFIFIFKFLRFYSYLKMSGIVEPKIYSIDGGYCSGASDTEDKKQTYIARCSCCGKPLSNPIINPVGPDNSDFRLDWCPGLSDCLLTILELNTLIRNILNYKNKDPHNKFINAIYKQKRTYNNFSDIIEDNNYREISSTLLYIIQIKNNKYFSKINKDTLALKIITSWFIGNKDRIYSLAILLQDITNNL